MAVVVSRSISHGLGNAVGGANQLMCIGAMEGVRLSRATTPLARIAQWLCFCTLLTALFWLIFSRLRLTADGAQRLPADRNAVLLAVAPGQLARKAIGISTFPGLFTLPLLIAGAWVSAVVLQRQRRVFTGRGGTHRCRRCCGLFCRTKVRSRETRASN